MSFKFQKLKKVVNISLIKLLILLFLAFAVAGVLGFWIAKVKGLKYTAEIVNTIKPIRENNFNYKYIFPLLSYDFSKANPFLRNKDLDDKINTFVSEQIKQKNAEDISVFVRNFSDNRWAGKNEDDKYHPGSILKVLIMMAYFREAQINPSILGQTLVYSKEMERQATSLDYSLPSSLIVGGSYSVNTLMQKMVAESDNGAQTLLINNVDRKILNSSYEDLAIPNPDITKGDYTISARQYAAFLRILYNSTYLSEDYSEKALGIMSQSTYTDGISAGLPQNIVVAQKYGERVTSNPDQSITTELHDCGIVYAPDHPYVICIMTKGNDIEKQSSIIKNISSLVYNNLITQD